MWCQITYLLFVLADLSPKLSCRLLGDILSDDAFFNALPLTECTLFHFPVGVTYLLCMKSRLSGSHIG